MPSTLPNITNVPPGGWEYKIPETGKVVSGSNLNDIRGKIDSQLIGGGYQIPVDINQKIEAYMCGLERMNGYCEERPTSIFDTAPKSLTAAGNLYHTFHAAVQCLRTLITHRGGTGERITQEQAETRAAVCATCPKNTTVSGCSKCNDGVIGQLINKIVGAGKTSRDGELKFCEVCHCNLSAKIWTKHEAIFKHMPEGQKKSLPESCWILTESK